MKRSEPVLSLLTFFLALNITLVTITSATPQKEIRIGAVVSLIGPAAEQGKNWLEGAKLAEDELRSQGNSVRLFVEEDSSNPTKAAAAFTKFATINKMDAVIGGTWDILAEATYPLTKYYRIPFIVPTNPPETLSISAKSNPYVFSSSFSMSAAKDGIRSFLRLHPSNAMYLIYWGGPYGQHHAKIIKELGTEMGFRILGEMEIGAGGSQEVEAALKLGAMKAVQSNSDTVFLLADQSGIESFLKELARLKSDLVVVCTHHLGAAFDAASNKSIYKKAYGIYPGYKHEELDDKFEKKYGHKPKVYAESGYDTVIFVAKALLAGVQLTDPTASFFHEGATGHFFLPPDMNRGIVNTSSVVMTTKNGVFEIDK